MYKLRISAWFYTDGDWYFKIFKGMNNTGWGEYSFDYETDMSEDVKELCTLGLYKLNQFQENVSEDGHEVIDDIVKEQMRCINGLGICSVEYTKGAFDEELPYVHCCMVSGNSDGYIKVSLVKA